MKVIRRLGILAGVGIISFATAGNSNAATIPTLFANVSQDGALVSGSGVSSVTKLGGGQYEVTMTSDVSACAYVATTINAYSQALQVFTAGGHLSANGVYLETKNQGGGLTDGPFNLIVDCGNIVMDFAVVGYSGELVRSTPGTTVTDLGAGRYNARFPQSVHACAYIATVGDPGNALVFSPAGVYTASGADARTVYVETKNPGGGLSAGVPFHLAVVCPKAAATNVRAAVVADNGVINRGSTLTASFNSATGEYDVVTNAAIDPACATVATRGSIDRAVPFTPATIELVHGPATNTIGLDVRELLFFGGDHINQAFHAATACR
jgi:hypothetical protein